MALLTASRPYRAMRLVAEGGFEVEVHDLIQRLAAGEASALAEAYDRHGEDLRGFATRLVGDAAAAEDLVQEVFLALPKAARKFEGRCSLRSYLKSIAANLCRRHVRSAARFRAAKDRMAREPSHSDPGPGQRQEQREMAEILARGLDQLSMELRVAFVLCAIEDTSSVEAAAILGIPENTVRTRVFRAREKLRAFLEAEAGR